MPGVKNWVRNQKNFLQNLHYSKLCMWDSVLLLLIYADTNSRRQKLTLPPRRKPSNSAGTLVDVRNCHKGTLLTYTLLFGEVTLPLLETSFLEREPLLMMGFMVVQVVLPLLKA
jgi:hypothetical protein